MKSIRINYRTSSPNPDKIKRFADSFKSDKYKISVKVYDFSIGEKLPPDDSFLYEKRPFEESSDSNDFIVLESKRDGADICAIFNDNVEFFGNVDRIIDEFDDHTGSVYSDYITNGVYFYLKSPPVVNMTAVLLFVSLDKISSDSGIIENIFSSHVSKHIPEGLCSVINE
jgi:hypothetical protein